MFLNSKYTIKIPKDIKFFYCPTKQLIILSKMLELKMMRLKVKIFLLPKSHLIVVSNRCVDKQYLHFGKISSKLRSLTTTQIKKVLIEFTYNVNSKLRFYGVGYKVQFSQLNEKILTLQLGFSHSILIKVPLTMKIKCMKSSLLFLYGNHSLNENRQFASFIRSYRKPEPYKGKGILYSEELVVLKKGKKV